MLSIIVALTCQQNEKNKNAIKRIWTRRSVATAGPGGPSSLLQFPNQTRSKNFSFKHQGYCFLRMFRNYTDQKFHNF